MRAVTAIHKNTSTRFAKIQSDRMTRYIDNYCYETGWQYGGPGYNRRVGVCLRYSLALSNSTDGQNKTIYFFVTEDGIHHNNRSNLSYTRIDGEIRTVRWYEDYIEEQLEWGVGSLLCMDDIPDVIRLDGNVRRFVTLDDLPGCQEEVCLAKSTLQKVYHIRISPWRYSVVYCLGPVCASAFHVVIVKGESVTMDVLCNRQEYQGKCIQRIEQVAKAVLQTQRVGDIDITFVAAESRAMRKFLLGVQLLVDHIWVLSSLVLCSTVFWAHSTNKHHRMCIGRTHLLNEIHQKKQ